MSLLQALGPFSPYKVEQAMEEDFLSAKKIEDFLVVESDAERLVERMSKLCLERTTVAPTPIEANHQPTEP